MQSAASAPCITAARSRNAVDIIKHIIEALEEKLVGSSDVRLATPHSVAQLERITEAILLLKQANIKLVSFEAMGQAREPRPRPQAASVDLMSIIDEISANEDLLDKISATADRALAKRSRAADLK